MDRLEKLFYLPGPDYRLQIENHPEFEMASVTSAILSRNQKFLLELNITGTIQLKYGVLGDGDGPPGTFIKGLSLPTYEGENSVYRFKFEFCHAENGHTNFPENKQTITLEPHKVEQVRKAPSHSNRYTILYFLNGLDRSKLNYSSHFRVENQSHTKIKIQGSEFVSLQDLSFEGVAVQPIKIGEYQAYFGLAPKEYSGDIKTSFLIIDGDLEMEDGYPFSVGRFLSLIFGGEFIVYGSSKLDSDLRINYAEYANVTTDYFDNFSRHHPHPILPVGMRFRHNQVNLAEDISKLYQAYFRKKDTFNLDIITWYLIQSYYLPLEIKVQPMATAFDRLTESWFQSGETISKVRDIEDSDFQEIVSDLLKMASERLKHIPNYEKIIQRMKYANNWGHSERGKAFLKQLGVHLSSDEKEILAFRHSVVHGGNQSRDAESLYRMTNGYGSLLSRIILKILGHKGRYVDYANVDFPARGIDESIIIGK